MKCFGFVLVCIQVLSDFILESERESFIDQVQEIIDVADEKRESAKDGHPQVFIYLFILHSGKRTQASLLTFCFFFIIIIGDI